MFNPTKNLLEGIRNAFPLQQFPWDDYYPQMAEADWLSGSAATLAVKSFFIRKAPFNGSFALLGGITDALRTIADLCLDVTDFRRGMIDMGYRQDFVDYLARRQTLKLKVFAPSEGSVFFPNEPVVTIVGSLPDIRLGEGILLEALNFPSLSLTKWHRLVTAVRPGMVLDFSRRRAQHSLKTALYAMLAGASRTSNSELRRFFDVWVAGTMGHEWIQRYGDPHEAFDAWLACKPHKPIGLVDTKRCMEYDFPAWLMAVEKHRDAIKAANPAIWGWRNDSGDLTYLTIEQYRRFMKHPLAGDPWFLDRMRIVLTNDLDEHKATSIIQQIRTQAASAGLDAEDILRRIIWAAGTLPGTCDDQPSLGGVAKLMEVDDHACIKLAFDAQGLPGIKTSIPGFNRSAIIRDEHGEIKCLWIYQARRYEIRDDGQVYVKGVGSWYRFHPLIARHQDNPAALMKLEEYHATPQQKLVFDSVDGNGFTDQFDDPTIASVVAHVRTGVDLLHWSSLRLDNPHPVKVSLSNDLFELRQRMIKEGALREDQLMG